MMLSVCPLSGLRKNGTIIGKDAGTGGSLRSLAGACPMIAGKILAKVAEPALWFAGLLLLWQALVWLFHVPVFILPAPSEFLAAHCHRSSAPCDRGPHYDAARHLWLSCRCRPGRRPRIHHCQFAHSGAVPLPVVVFIQGLPKITLAPLMLVWFGYSIFPKILLTALITFFPILVDSVAGFKSVDRRHYYLTRSSGASWWQTFRRSSCRLRRRASFRASRSRSSWP